MAMTASIVRRGNATLRANPTGKCSPAGASGALIEVMKRFASHAALHRSLAAIGRYGSKCEVEAGGSHVRCAPESDAEDVRSEVTNRVPAQQGDRRKARLATT